MSRKNAWVVGLGLAAVLILAISWATGALAGGPEEGVQVREETEDSGAMAGRDAGAPGEDSLAAEETRGRKQVGSSADKDEGKAATRGSLTVHVFWHDGKPAPDVAIWCVGVSARLPGGPRVEISNPEGLVRFADLRAGSVKLRSGREGRMKVEVIAGVDSEVRFEIPRGVDIQGTVTLENGAPVQGASIWLASRYVDWRGGRFVARSAKDGSFAIRSARKGASVGAIAVGYERSKLIDLDTLDTSQSPVALRLILEPGGGTLLVQVLDPARKPVEGARIAVGKMPRNHGTHPNFETAEVWTPLMAITDTAGIARLHGLRLGEQDLAVSAEGYPIWNGSAKIEAHFPAQSLVVLAKPVVVEGVVKDGEQKPVAGAIVRAVPKPFDEIFLQSGQFDFKSVFGYPQTESDAQGHYRLDAIAPGTVHLYAIEDGRTSIGKARVHASRTLQAIAGARLRWDPVLSAGRTIRGLVTYRDGKPMKNFFITAIEQGTGKRLVITTDQKGRFRFVNLTAVKHDISVQLWSPRPGTPPLFKKDVWPDQGQVHLVASYNAPVKLPPGSVIGKVRDDHGRFATGVKLNVTLHSDRGWFRPNPKITGMEFRFDKVKPGRYRLDAKAGTVTVAVSDWFEVQARQEFDSGTLLTTPAGQLELTLIRSQGAESIEPRLYLRRKDKAHSHSAKLGKRDHKRVPNISVGAYTYTLSAQGMATERGEVEIRAGQSATLQIHLVPAVVREIRIRFPSTAEGKLQVSILDARGKEIWSNKSMDTSKLAGLSKLKIRMPIGSFSLAAQVGTSVNGSRQFVMKTLDPEQPPIELQLR